ncbi:MAG TPA: hypothetical protein VNF73_15295 [Candidatus Saccharimonadales bacterium]|nr:hypothetical protein [Candidatus Saccharimonadales bacterium]
MSGRSLARLVVTLVARLLFLGAPAAANARDVNEPVPITAPAS